MVEIDEKGFYVTSDLHLFHRNIIEYCDRPFKSVEEMNAVLFANWNRTVSNEDVIFFLGDFIFGRKTNAKKIWEALNGEKYFLHGNHDKRLGKFSEDVLTTNCRQNITVRYREKDIVLSHFPLPDYHGDILLYGHVHNNGDPDVRCGFNVSIENTRYKPIHIDEIFRILGIT